jgi:predicted ribosomally synthesized peptide with nif11-like leader
MSVENFKKYGKRCAEDPKVRERAKKIGMGDIKGQIAYAKELGLEFTIDDMNALAQEAGISKAELSEEQLEQVAGGAVTSTAAVVGAVIGVVAAATGVVSAGAAVTSASTARGW